MKVQGKSKPWRVVFLGDGKSKEGDFTSKDMAFAAVRGECEVIRAGSSEMTRAVVYHWDGKLARWMPSQRINLTAMVEEISAIEAFQAKQAEEAASIEIEDDHEEKVEAAAKKVAEVSEGLNRKLAGPAKKVAVRKPRKAKPQDAS